MARVFLMVFESTGPSTLIKKIRNAGHKVAVAEPRYPAFYALLKQQSTPPEIFVVDCSRLPSHARESCNYIQTLQAYRDARFLLYNVKPEDEAKTLQRVRGARLLRDDDVLPTLERWVTETGPAASGAT